MPSRGRCRCQQYFESLRLPSAGIRSFERATSKNDFYEMTRQRGAPPVPETKNFPLFVKPAYGCASQLIDEHSICHHEKELGYALGRINKRLHEARLRTAIERGINDPVAYANSFKAAERNRSDIAVQEFVEGQYYLVSVIALGEAAVALPPCIVKRKALAGNDKFLKFELKFDPETHLELIKKDDNPKLFQRLQQVALESFETGNYSRSNLWCDVDIRVRPDGEVFVLEVNPQLAAFLTQYPDLPIMYGLPGGHTAAINIFIANHFLRQSLAGNTLSKIASTYDKIAHIYNDIIQINSQITHIIEDVVQEFNFQGRIFDLACRTGILGDAFSKRRQSRGSAQVSRIVGFDIPPRMAEICRKIGAYEEVYVERMELALLQHLKHGAVDLIMCFSAIHFLSPELFSFVLAVSFLTAGRTITVGVDEILDVYKENLRARGHSHVHSTDHIENMEAFGDPPGWRLVSRKRQYCWTSPVTSDDNYTATVFHFERVEGRTSDVEFLNMQLLN